MPNRDYGIHSRSEDALARPSEPKRTAVKAAAPKPPEPGKKSDAAIEEATKESFPASDPPSSWAGPDLTPEQRAEKAAQEQAARRKNTE